MKKFKFTLLIFCFVAISTFFSCGTSETVDVDPPADNSLLFATDIGLPQPEINQVVNFVNDAFDFGLGKKRTDFLFCATFSHDDINKTVEIDFGTNGCGDIIFRTGKITITYIGDPTSQGNRTVTFNDFTFNGNEISGTIKISQISTNANDNLVMNVELENIIFKRKDGKTITLSAIQKFEWTAGSGNQNPNDDVLEISGNSNGTNSQGFEFTSQTSIPLVYETACLATMVPYPVKGVQTITPSNDPSFVLDYGNGSCDKNATITVGNFTTDVVFP